MLHGSYEERSALRIADAPRVYALEAFVYEGSNVSKSLPLWTQKITAKTVAQAEWKARQILRAMMPALGDGHAILYKLFRLPMETSCCDGFLTPPLRPALVRCARCGEEYEDDCPLCPECGGTEVA